MAYVRGTPLGFNLGLHAVDSCLHFFLENLLPKKKIIRITCLELGKDPKPSLRVTWSQWQSLHALRRPSRGGCVDGSGPCLRGRHPTRRRQSPSSHPRSLSQHTCHPRSLSQHTCHPHTCHPRSLSLNIPATLDLSLNIPATLIPATLALPRHTCHPDRQVC